MNLENYISQLLYRTQCLVIPGFGTFLTEIQSVKYDEKGNFFYPPKKVVSFDIFYNENDEKLVDYITNLEGKSKKDTLVNIILEVENWHSKLQDFGKFSIEKIGDFYLNNENRISFEPISTSNYLTDAFGLNIIKSPDFVIEKYNNLNNQLLDDLKETPVIPLIPLKQNHKNWYYKYAAILLLISVIEAKYIIQLNDETLDQKNIILEKKIQQEVYNKIQTATFFIENPLENLVESYPKKLKYYIISNSFKSIKNAQNEFKRLKIKGYYPTILPANRNGIYQVSYQNFDNLDDAKAAELKIKNKNNLKVWTLIQKIE